MTINKKFSPLFEGLGKSKFYQIYGGRSSGKTYATQAAILKYISENDNKTVVYSYGGGFHDWLMVSDFMIDGEHIEANRALKTITHKITGSKIVLTEDIYNHNPNIVVFDEIWEDCNNIEDLIKNHKNKSIESYIFTYNEPIEVIKEHFFVNGKPNNVLSNTVFIETDYTDNLNNLHGSTIEHYENYKKTEPIYYKNVILGKFK